MCCDNTPNIRSCQEILAVLVWGTMEIALLPKSGLRVKGKSATIAIDPQDKSAYKAVLAMTKSPDEVTKSDEAVSIFSTGEYEVGGMKISGTRVDNVTIYSIIVDSVDVLIGPLNALEKIHNKLQEHNIVVVNCDEVGNASFVTSLTENVTIFYGDKASEVAQAFGKENVKPMNKYSSTKDKLPAEVETILLASSA